MSATIYTKILKYISTHIFIWAQLVKNLPAMLETLVQFLGWEDLLEKGWLPLQYSRASLVVQLVNN